MSKIVKKKIIKDKDDDAIDREFDKLLKAKEDDPDISQSLKEIYDDESPLIAVKDQENMPNKNNYKIVSRREANPWTRIYWAFLFLLFVFAVVSWASFYIFNQGNRLNAKDIELKLTGPETVAVGEEIIYEIQYKNLSEFNLKNAEIYFQYPENFVFIDAVPAFIENAIADPVDKPVGVVGNYKIWKFDQIDSKRSGRIEIKGKIIDLLDSEQDFTVNIKYRPENFSSTFSADDSIKTKVNLLGINVSVEAPSFFSLNEESDFIIKYTKQKDSFIEKFNILLEHGDNFSINSNNKDGLWEINEVKDSEEKITIKGTFLQKPKEGEKLKILLTLPIKLDNNTNEDGSAFAEATAGRRDYVFYEYEILPIVAEGALTLTLTANGSVAERAVNFNDDINYVAHYKNSSEASLKNVIIMAVINSEVVDWSTFKDDNKGERRDNVILWTKEEIKELGDISPGQESSFGFSIKVKPRDEIKDVAINDYQVKTSLDYSIDSAIKNNSTPVTQITSKINSDLNIINELRYFDREGIAVGEGPLPPKANEKTTFKVYWTLTNNLHDLKNIEVYADLPEYVQWENNYNSGLGKIKYDSQSRKVTWQVSSWDAIDEPAMANFTISITPSEKDKNKILTILNQTQVEAKDSATNGLIILTSKAKTSNLEDDGVGKGYGKVE